MKAAVGMIPSVTRITPATRSGSTDGGLTMPNDYSTTVEVANIAKIARDGLRVALESALTVLRSGGAMRTREILLAAAAITAAGCSKTKEGDVVVDKPVGIETQKDTLNVPTVTTKTDSVNVPVVGTKTDTLIVKKPVVGTEKKAVKVPVVKKP